MAYRQGSEEFYRYRPGQPGPPVSYNPITLDLLRQNSQTALAQQDRMLDIQNRASDRRLADMDKLGDRFERGIDRREAAKDRDVIREREARRFSTEEAQAREASEQRQLQAKLMNQQMEDSRRESEFRWGSQAGGKSRAEQDYERGITNENLNQQLVRAQIAGLSGDRKTVQADRNVENLSNLMKGAVAASDQAKLANLRAQGAQMGLSEFDIKRAEQLAAEKVASGGTSKDIAYQGSPEGQLATQRLVEINKVADALVNFNEAAERYRESNLAGTTDYGQIALEDMRNALVEMGEDPAQINREWYGARQGKIDELVARIQAKVERKLELAEAGAGSAGPGIRGSFQNTRALLQKAGVKQKPATVDLFSGQPGQPGQPSPLMQFISSGQPPHQQSPMMPLAPAPTPVSPAAQGQQQSQQQGVSRFRRGP